MTDADGWIEHDGKGMPVGKVVVATLYRDGTEFSIPAEFPLGRWVGWDWSAAETPDDHITHYRVATPAEPAPVLTDALTPRDQFALAAIPYFMGAVPAPPEGTLPDVFGTVVAKHVYAFADAMLAQRDKK